MITDDFGDRMKHEGSERRGPVVQSAPTSVRLALITSFSWSLLCLLPL